MVCRSWGSLFFNRQGWVLLALWLACGGALESAPALFKDLNISNTVIVRDLNGTGMAPVNYGGGVAPVETNAGGVSTFNYTGAASDPMIILNSPAGTFDFATFNWARLRYRSSSAPQIWENSAVGGQSFNGGANAAAFLEARGDPANPNPTGSGYRIDPVNSVTAGTPYTFELDYFMADRMQTLGLGEWDADGDFNGPSASGSTWTGSNLTGLTVSGGVISGTGSGDAVLNQGMSFNGATWGLVEIRMKATGSFAEFFWANNGSFVGAQRVDLGSQDGSYHVYTLDFSKESTWISGANMRLRLDPVTVAGQSFEVDYVRVMQVPVGYWDADGNTTAATGGSGVWESSQTNRSWRGEQSSTAGGGLPTYWVNSPYDDAAFAGTAGTVTVNGSLTVNDLSIQTSGYLITSGTLTLAGAAPAIEVTTGASEVQSTLAGTAGLNKTGSGTLVLSGSNSYSGGTAVSAGTLLVANGSGSATGTGAVNVAAGATLGGNGSLSGAVTVNGRLSPGGDGSLMNHGIGVLRTGALTLTASSNGSVLELAGNGYASDTLTLQGGSGINTGYIGTAGNRVAGRNDRLDVLGALNLSEAGSVQVAFADGYLPAYGHAYDLLDWSSLTITNFTYGSLGTLRTGGDLENASFDLDLPDLNSASTGLYYNMDAFLSHGVIVVVPEPGRMALLLCAGFCLLLRRRRAGLA